MKASIYWIETTKKGRLAVLGRPRAGDWLEDEIKSWRESKIDVVVSLLVDYEVEELGLTQQAEICSQNKIDYISFPIYDRQCPDQDKTTADFIAKLAKLIVNGHSVGVHCRSSVGRATLVVASVLILFDVTAQAALERISKSRRCEVPDTLEQRKWIEEFSGSHFEN
ncbi:hypothetical protein [Candidatus Uabimicrobium sp. HlEnr_7]|uniref:protein-tyrosine phosphatase family protein n=1 Tax=Candidatus Uabimicrobium helgolandensis TaxID=3095367 RepID=UPI0035590D74